MYAPEINVLNPVTFAPGDSRPDHPELGIFYQEVSAIRRHLRRRQHLTVIPGKPNRRQGADLDPLVFDFGFLSFESFGGVENNRDFWTLALDCRDRDPNADQRCNNW
jgi:hypothetical protein